MRMSCNGCRVLRKGCSENCSIKPCLEWIKSPESQANATVFLAKFYGRAGLLNLVNAGPEHLRPAIFRSLLYEACGRIVNPIYGSVGLLWSGSWNLCQNAVEAVLRGSPIVQIGSEVAEKNNGPPLKAYDIRHISKEDKDNHSNELHRVRTRGKFKKSSSKAKVNCLSVLEKFENDDSGHDEANRSTSHESSLCHLSEVALVIEAESLASAEAASFSVGPGPKFGAAHEPLDAAEDGEVELELTLGLEPVHKKSGSNIVCRTPVLDGLIEIELGLGSPAQA